MMYYRNLTVLLTSISCIVSETKHIFVCLLDVLKNYVLGFITKVVKCLGRVGRQTQTHQRILSQGIIQEGSRSRNYNFHMGRFIRDKWDLSCKMQPNFLFETYSVQTALCPFVLLIQFFPQELCRSTLFSPQLCVRPVWHLTDGPIIICIFPLAFCFFSILADVVARLMPHLPTPRDAHILIPKTCRMYYVTWQWAIKVADGVKVANQLVLRWEIDLHYLGRASVIKGSL